MELLVCLNSRHSAIKAKSSLANTVSPSPPPQKKLRFISLLFYLNPCQKCKYKLNYFFLHILLLMFCSSCTVTLS